jgi:transcriptional regulator with XRE-family HTH domain
VIGARIRQLRTVRSLTATELAKVAQVSPGLISQVERGITDPSLETLRRIARALDVPLFSLFAGEDVEPVAVVRAGRRARVQSPQGGISYDRLSAGGKVEVLEGRLEPGAASSDEAWAHPSEECAVVLAGQLTVEVDGERQVLHPGDSATFDSRRPHRYLNENCRPVRFLVAVSPPSY